MGCSPQSMSCCHGAFCGGSKVECGVTNYIQIDFPRSGLVVCDMHRDGCPLL